MVQPLVQVAVLLVQGAVAVVLQVEGQTPS
jgi:hypothetical protein